MVHRNFATNAYKVQLLQLFKRKQKNKEIMISRYEYF